MTKVQKHSFFTKKSLLHLSYNSVFFLFRSFFIKNVLLFGKRVDEK